MSEFINAESFSLTLNGQPVSGVVNPPAEPELTENPAQTPLNVAGSFTATCSDPSKITEFLHACTNAKFGGLTYGSVCSGIEAASVAWEPLGWHPAWFAEIESFPSAVLAHRWPNVTNLGDMTTIGARVHAGDVIAPDVLVGGTPCQAFSLSGLRGGLNDERGQLTLHYVKLANEIDDRRKAEGKPPAIIVWENVFGVTIDNTNAFGHLLAGLAGEDAAFEPGPRPARARHSKFWRWDKKTGEHVPRWGKSGFVDGPQRRVAWRILDAQHFGVPQRRERVFIVASARNDIDPGAILFEFEGVRRDSAPVREAQESITGTLSARTNGGGGLGTDFEFAGGLQPVKAYRMMAFGEYADDNLASTMQARDHKGATDLAVLAFPEYMSGTQCAAAHAVSPTLQALNPTAIAYAVATYQEGITGVFGDVAHTLTSEGHDASEDGTGRGTPVIAMQETLRVRRLTPVECERLQGFPESHTLIPYDKRPRMAPDDLEYVRLHVSGISDEDAYRLASDAVRYRALGNSMAVPVMRWIGEQIGCAVAAVAKQAVLIAHQKESPEQAASDGIVQVVSFSGGRTSAYLVYLMEKRRKQGESIHYLYMDTGAEHPKTYEFIRNLVKEWNIPLTCLRVKVNPKLGEANSYEIIDINQMGPDLKPWRDICAKYGTPYLHGPFCSRTMKKEVFERFCQETFGQYHTWLGIRADEKRRLGIREGISYLADISSFDKQDVIAWWAGQTFDLSIDEHLGNCIFCVKKSVNKIALAVRDEPELASEFMSIISSDEVRVIERRQQENKVMYRGNNSLDSIIAIFADYSRSEIASTIRGLKQNDTGSCTESCEGLLSDSVDDGAPVETYSPPSPFLAPITKTRPFLKWAGGKYKYLDVIASYLPEGNRLIEPFVGAGSVFMNMRFKEYLLADVNPDLINLYRQLEETPNTVINAARQLVESCVSNSAYLKIREEFNGRESHATRHAALFLALLRTCFNGLCRYNLKEVFNVGWCKKVSPKVYFPERELADFIASGQRREFFCGSFQETIARAGAGDVVFCDPPYEPMPGQNGFTAYANGSFTFDHQIALVEACVAAHQRGARIVITNSSAPLIVDLYSKHGFKVHTFIARRAISSDASTRGDVIDTISVL